MIGAIASSLRGKVASRADHSASQRPQFGEVFTRLAPMGVADATASGRRPSRKRLREGDIEPVEELVRILHAKPQRFRLQFFGVATERGPSVLEEIEIVAAGAEEAVREADRRPWPPGAIGYRILDHDGREAAERMRG